MTTSEERGSWPSNPHTIAYHPRSPEGGPYPDHPGRHAVDNIGVGTQHTGECDLIRTVGRVNATIHEIPRDAHEHRLVYDRVTRPMVETVVQLHSPVGTIHNPLVDVFEVLGTMAGIALRVGPFLPVPVGLAPVASVDAVSRLVLVAGWTLPVRADSNVHGAGVRVDEAPRPYRWRPFDPTDGVGVGATTVMGSVRPSLAGGGNRCRR